MKTTLPFVHSGSFLAGRWRDPKRLDVVDFIEVDVREVSGDARAVSWNKPIFDYLTYRLGNRYRHDCVFAADGFYMPIGVDRSEFNGRPEAFPAAGLPDGNWKALPSAVIANLLGLTGLPDYDARRKLVEAWYETGALADVLRDLPVRNVTGADLEERRAAAVAAARDLLVADGEVYVRIEEPKLYLAATSMHVPGREGWVSGVHYGPAEVGAWLPDLSRHAGGPDDVLFFPMTGRDGLSSALSAVAPDLATLDRVEDLAVFRPEVFSFDRSADVVRRTAQHALMSLANVLDHLDRRAVNLWFDIREAMEAYVASLDNDLLSLEAVTADVVPRLASAVRPIFSETAASLEACLEQWDTISISIEERVIGNEARP
jgi:hypothetical protein